MARPILTASVALTLCALAVGCSRQAEAPTPQSASEVAATTASAPQEAPEASLDSPQAPPKDDNARIRRAIRESMAEKYPNSEVEGIWILQARGNYCFAGADTVINSRHRNIDVLVRQYVRDDGSEYWRAEVWGPDTSRMLQSQLQQAPPSSSDDN